MSELRITVNPPVGGTLQLQIQGGNNPPAGVFVQRPVPQIDPDRLESFRRSEIAAADLDQLTTAVNDWLLDVQVRGILTTALPAHNGNSLRLVFVVPDEVRDILATVPLELLWHDAPGKPLVLRNDVQSLVYVLSKSTLPPENLSSRNWPLKILIVRPNPPDLGGLVPTVAGLKTHVLNESAHYGSGMVQVDVISGEVGIGRPATWPALMQHLRLTNDYNLLVYLGHGELTAPPAGGQPIGHLYFESEDGGGHQPVGAPQLAKLLSRYPIPVVVLTGCLTGADPPGTADRHRGGEQGVAQALVNSSESGVQVAVGMRMELRDKSAITFLNAFFTSLLGPHGSPGNVDRAVWEGRNELFLLDGVFPPNWAAPIVLRASDHEPVIDYLSQPVTFKVSKDMGKWLDLRGALWNRLSDAFAQSGPDALMGIMVALDEVEEGLRSEGVKHGPLLLPGRRMIVPNSEDQLSIKVAGALRASALQCRLRIDGDAASVQSFMISQAVQDAGFQLLTTAQDNSYFEIRSKTGESNVVPNGELIRASVKASKVKPGAYPLTLEVKDVSPKQPLWPGDNILLVPGS